MRMFTIVVKVPEDFGDYFGEFDSDDPDDIISDILISEAEWAGTSIEVVSIVEEE